MVRALQDLDEVAALADGGPQTTIQDSDPGASVEVVRSRLGAALKQDGLAPGHRVLLEAASRASLPVEPRFYEDAYYQDPAQPSGRSNTTLGKIEEGLREAMAAAQAWLQVAG